MKKLKQLTFSLGILLTLRSFSASAYDVNLSVGNLCEYVGKIQTDDIGSMNVCTFKPYLATAIDYSVTSDIIVSPEIGFSLPKHGRDENIDEMNLFLLANGKYKFSNFHLIAGVGIFLTRIAGNGGTEELNNGTSTSSFPLPDSTSYSSNTILNFGLGATFYSSWSADLHTYIFNAISKDDRAFSVAINGTYHFGEF